MLPQLDFVSIGKLGCLGAGFMVVLAGEIEGRSDVATLIEDVSTVLVHRHDLLREPVNLRQVARRWPEVGCLAPDPSSSRPVRNRIYTFGKKWQWVIWMTGA